MRLMAGFAGQAAGVLVGVYLWEALGFGGTGRMTADTEDCGVEFGWGEWRRRAVRHCVHVFLQRAVAGFAVYGHVLAGGLGGDDVAVAGFAGSVSGEMNWTGGDLADGGSAVVAVFSEGLGHDVVANDEERHESDDEQSGKSEEMAYIFEAIHRAICPSGGDWTWGTLFHDNRHFYWYGSGYRAVCDREHR